MDVHGCKFTEHDLYHLHLACSKSGSKLRQYWQDKKICACEGSPPPSTEVYRHQVKVVYRERSATDIARCTILTETNKRSANSGNRKYVKVGDESDRWYVVQPTKSVIFCSINSNGVWYSYYYAWHNYADFGFIIDEIEIELSVIREAAMKGPFAVSLYDWLTEIVDDACDCRRDVRVCIFIYISLLLVLILYI